jgi:hypothetical protein
MTHQNSQKNPKNSIKKPYFLGNSQKYSRKSKSPYFFGEFEKSPIIGEIAYKYLSLA